MPDTAPGSRGARLARGVGLHAAIVGASLLAPRLANLAERRMSRTTAATVATAVPTLALHVALELLERKRPFRQSWNQPHDDVGADLGHATIAGAMSGAIGTAALAGAMAALPAPVVRATHAAWPSKAPLVVKLYLGLAAMEFGHYWHHRSSHEWAPMWRFHAVHHAAPRLHWPNALWFHPLDLGALMFCERLPLRLLGLDRDTRLAVSVFGAVYGQLQHANIDLDSGPANLVFSTPDQHRWHHSNVLAEGNTDYGARVSLWDRVFGTYFLPRRRDFDGVVGVIGRPDYPLDILGQLAAPFRSAT